MMNETKQAPAAGFWDDAELISANSRAQAIEDGELVDLTALASEYGIKYPVAITRAAWTRCIEWTPEASTRKGGCYQDETGRAWDVLTMFRYAAIKGGLSGATQTTFSVLRVPQEGRGTKARLATLKAICGPGDTLAPVITIMLPEED